MEEELSEEIRAHLEMLAEEFERRGMTPAEARLAARRSFGGVEQIREEHREARGLMHLQRLAADLSYALRMMRRTPGFTLLAVLTLALGIGVNATLFSAFNAVVLKPLPVADPGGVYRFERWFASHGAGNIQYGFSFPEYVYVRDHNRAFQSLVAASWPVSVTAEWQGAEAAERASCQMISANYFTALGVGMRLGAGLAPDADRVAGASPVVVLSHHYWQRRWNGDTNVVGRVVKVNGTAFTVAGVAAEEFTGTSQSANVPDFWAPYSMVADLAPGTEWLNNPDRALTQILSRVKPGMSLRTAQAESALLMRQFGATHTERDKTVDVTLQHVSYFDNTEDWRFQATVAGIMLVVGMVLAVACANLANMMLARGAGRQREIGVRLAMGASRARVVRQLLTESAVLGLAGGLAGLALSMWCSRILWLWVEGSVLRHLFGASRFAVDMSVDWRVLGYTMVVSLVTGLLFGLSPALQFTRPNLMATLKEEGPSYGRLNRSRLRSFLIATQVTVSMMLLITGGLLARGLLRSRIADPGFATGSLYMLSADFGDDAQKSTIRQRRLTERLRSLPGVSGIATGTVPMLGTWTPPILVGGRQGRTLASYASERYLETMGIALLAGRAFTRQEAERNAPVAVISESTSRLFWAGQDPIGRRFQLDTDFRGTLKEFEVIGVAKDVRFANLTRVDPAHVYLTPKLGGLGGFENALVRIQGEPRATIAVIRSAVQMADPNLMSALSLYSIEDGPLWLQKMQAQAMAVAVLTLAVLALLLAGVGIYGVMAYLVSQRTREIGIRMALGAAAGDVVRDVVVGGLRPVFMGIVLGMMAAAGLSAVLHATLVYPGSMDVLYGVRFYDPLTFLGLAGFLLGVAALASALPARRAARVDPMVALRYE